MTTINLFGEVDTLPRDLVRVHFTIEDTDTGEESEGYGLAERTALEEALNDRGGVTPVDVEVTEWIRKPDLVEILAGIGPVTVSCTRNELEVLP
jgi:hypothetical protein